MGEALLLDAVMGEDGKLDCPGLDVPPGTHLKISVEKVAPQKKKRRLMEFFGVGRGTFGSEEAILEHLRDEREASEKRFSR